MHNARLNVVPLRARPRNWLAIAMWLSAMVMPALLGIALGAALAHLKVL